MSINYDSFESTIQNNGMRWWDSPQKDLHLNILAYVGYLNRNQSYRSSDNLRFMRLYGNYELLGLDSYSYTRIETSHNVHHRVTLNVVQSMIDTVVSKIAKNKPKPMFLTSGGDFSLQRKAKKLSKYVEGVMQSCDTYEKARMAFKESAIFGTGALKVFEQDGNIKIERVFIDEIKVDDTESFYGDPRQIHQVKYIHRDVLIEMFPQHKNEILVAVDAESVYSSSRGTRDKQMLMVTESWHLPSGPTHDKKGKPIKHDGKHALSIANCTLFEEEYSKTYFPFVFFHWTKRPLGFFGQGLCEQLQGIQLEINKILRTIQVSMHLTSIPKVFVEAGSKVVVDHLNNKIGGIIKYAGTKPSYESVGAIPRELFEHLDRLYQRAYEITGISQLSAQARKPGGLDSGKALRTFNDIESERFMEIGQRYEEAFVKLAEIVVDMSRDIYQDNKDLKINVKGKKFIETIKWSDVDMQEDKYMLDVFPVSALSSTPSGRMAEVQEMVQAGFIPPEYATTLLDFPDLESVYNGLTASYQDISKMIEDMMDGEYISPEPFQNLQLGIEMCQNAYLHYRSQNAPDERLELLRRWMDEANSLITKGQQPEVPPMGAGDISVDPNAPITPTAPGNAPIAQPAAGGQAIAPAEAIPPSNLVPQR